MLTTLSVPTSGTGRVAGYDVIKDPAAVRRSMGLTGQSATIDELLTGRENIRLIGRLYGLPTSYLRKKSDELLERFLLTDAADRVVTILDQQAAPVSGSPVGPPPLQI